MSRLRFFDFLVRMCRLKAFWNVISPVPVILNLFLALEFVLTFGILLMRFYMIPCWRIYTGKSLRGPFGQSGGFPLPGSPAIKNGARSYGFFVKMGIIS